MQRMTLHAWLLHLVRANSEMGPRDSTTVPLSLLSAHNECGHHFDCGSCVAHGCGFCDAKDVRTCFKPNSTASRSGICRGDLRVSASQCSIAVVDPHACPRGQPILPCSINASSCVRGCCTIGTIPWLVERHSSHDNPDSFVRVDVIAKALVAEQWRLGNGPDNNVTAAFERFQAFKLHRGRPEQERTTHRAASRMDMYRILYGSVREQGLVWEDHPIEVNSHLHLLDGAHRLALALAFQQQQVTLLQTCSSRRVLPLTLAYLEHASPTLLPAARSAIVGLLAGDAECRWHERAPSSPTASSPPSTDTALAGSPAIAALSPPSAVGGSGVPAAKPIGMGLSSASSPEATHFFAIVWGCAKDLWPRVQSQIQQHNDLNITVIRSLHATHLGALLQRVYAVDDVSTDKVRLKERHLNLCPTEVMTLQLSSFVPRFRKKSNGKPISRQMEALKAEVRGKFQGEVRNYTHDIIFHAGDNEMHTRHLERVFGELRIEGSCNDTANKLACVPQVMQILNVSTDDYIIVGSAVLQDALGRPPSDVDILVRPSVRGRISHSPRALKLAPSVQMISANWLGGSGGVSDEAVLNEPRLHKWSIGATRLKYVRSELTWFRKCTTRRSKDLDDVNTAAKLPILWELDVADRLLRARSDAQVRACMDKVLRPHTEQPAVPAPPTPAGQRLNDDAQHAHAHAQTAPASELTLHGRDGSPTNRCHGALGSEELLSASFGPRQDPTHALIGHINASKSKVDVMAFWWTWLPIAEALVDAHMRGVQVRVLVDSRTTTKPVEGRDLVRPFGHDASTTVAYLQSQGVPVKVMRPAQHRKAIFHHKAVIVDSKFVCMGSSNWYSLSLRTFDDLTVCLCSLRTAERFTEFTERRWTSSGWPAAKETVSTKSCPPSPSDTSAQAAPTRAGSSISAFEVVEGPYFGPECRLDHVWFRYIASATRQVRIVHWRVEWEPLVPWLESASARGVSISIFSSRIAPPLLKINSTRAAWADHAHVFQPSNAKNASSNFHYKIVLIDDDLVLLGSCNLFGKSILEDSEDLVVLRSRDLSRQISLMYDNHKQFPRPGASAGGAPVLAPRETQQQKMGTERGGVEVSRVAGSGTIEYDPLPAAAHIRIGSSRPAQCAFVTAGPSTYVGAMNCVSRRLDALHSRYPLITFVPEEEEEAMRAKLHQNRHSGSMILPWRRFPADGHNFGADGLRGARVMDKLNIFGLSSVARRLVWIDADIYIRSSFDELCELPDDITFAFTFASERGRPTRQWPSGHTSGCVTSYNVSEDRNNPPYTFRRPHELSPPAEKCSIIFNAGLLVFHTLDARAYNALIVGPVSNHSIRGYVATEQGYLNTLLYDSRCGLGWKASYAVLHPRFNTIHRFIQGAEALWSPLKAVGVHWTGKSGRPWLLNYTGSNPDEWHLGCSVPP